MNCIHANENRPGSWRPGTYGPWTEEEFQYFNSPEGKKVRDEHLRRHCDIHLLPDVEIDHKGLIWNLAHNRVIINVFQALHLWKRSVWWDLEGKFIPTSELSG